MSFRLRTNIALMLLAALLVAAPAGAAKQKSKEGSRAPEKTAPAASPETISKDEAVAMVRSRTGGRVVRAEAGAHKGRAVYRIRVLTGDGRVREYRVDALTGEMN
ncbi:MAG: PepSY domain-containing protein [Gammaproteobacteria bacterium]